VIKIFAGLLVIHGESGLIEIVLETLEDRALGSGVSLEMIAVLETLNSFLLLTT
jgi:hypothetical protein